MIKFHAMVFDDFLMDDTVAYTSIEFARDLASGDQIVLHAVLDQMVGVGQLVVTLEDSADGRDFLPKNATSDIIASGAPRGTSMQAYGSEPRNGPAGLGLVRAAIQITNPAGATPFAHVVLHATVRDASGPKEGCGCPGTDEAEEHFSLAHAAVARDRLRAAFPELGHHAVEELVAVARHAPRAALQELRESVPLHALAGVMPTGAGLYGELSARSRDDMAAFVRRLANLSPDVREALGVPTGEHLAALLTPEATP